MTLLGQDPALLVLADGTEFEGVSIGASRTDAASVAPVGVGELVFNTALSGYQEIVTDPSYAGQVITFTYPHIGNYGVNTDDDESRRPFCSGVVVRELAGHASNWRSQESLAALLERHGVPGIAGIDTRRLTRHLPRVRRAARRVRHRRCRGACRRGCGHRHRRTRPRRHRHHHRALRGGRRRRAVQRGGLRLRHQAHDPAPPRGRGLPGGGRAREHRPRRGAGPQPRRGVPLERTRRPDCGERGHGAGPRPRRGSTGVRHLLGHQILGLALGGATYKLRFGHHGGNHPVRHEASGRVEIDQPEPQLRDRRRLPRRCRRRRSHPREPERRGGRGLPVPGGAHVQRAVPPRSRARASRCPVPLRRLRRPHGRLPGATPWDMRRLRRTVLKAVFGRLPRA